MTPTTPETEYAFWTAPATSRRITYSLGVFHEIDFQVNEGYRRIPHGGIEIGGLLYGRTDKNSTQIEAFRPIDCEHASGPSFVLSDRDIATLRDQIKQSKTDPELAALDVLGWFVAHTRTPLKMNDREAAIFDELFPDPGKITLLIKPERFQPTRFGFLVRSPDSSISRDASEHAIILPLPGRATRSEGGPVASIPAPPEPTPKPAVPASVRPPEPEPPPNSPEPERTRRRPSAVTPVEPLAEPLTESTPRVQSPLDAAAHLDRTPPPRPKPPLPDPSTEDFTSLIPSPRGTSSLPSIDEIRRRRWEYLQGLGGIDERRTHLQLTGEVERQTLRSNLRLTLVLFLSAAIGCVVGYIAYLQLPSATIPLSVKAEPTALLVSWPAKLTRDSVYSAIRIDDGQQIALTPEQRAAGEATITGTSDNVKIEVIAAHWMRDSRGIIRYIKPTPPPPPPVEAAPAATSANTTPGAEQH